MSRERGSVEKASYIEKKFPNSFFSGENTTFVLQL